MTEARKFRFPAPPLPASRHEALGGPGEEISDTEQLDWEENQHAKPRSALLTFFYVAIPMAVGVGAIWMLWRCIGSAG